MTIDERLDRLTERHEALTQTVELITADIRNLTALMSQTDQFINQLARIAAAHEQRIDRLEGPQ
jgi:prefoldin subunit 5